MVDYISSTCRVCLMEGNRKVSLFEGHSTKKYSDLIKEYTGMEIIDNDNLPSSICDVCSSELLVVIKFVSKFRMTTHKLKNTTEFGDAFDKIKVENDDKIPLSSINTSIKEENGPGIKEEKGMYEIDSSDIYFPLEGKQQTEIEGNYRIAKPHEFGNKKYMIQCLSCGQLVQNKSAFIVHNRKHTGEKPCKCPECGKCFTQIGSLNDHVKRHHLKECLEQRGAFGDMFKKMRMKDKFGEYRFTCDACGKRFWKKGALTIHLRVHTKEKPYQCCYCPKRFAQYSEHLQHTRIHTGDKPYGCHICGKKFVAHTPLRRHLSTHSDERKYKCQICDKAVKSSDSLKKHILVMHTSEKNHMCDLCGASFVMKYNLKAHMKARHSERSGICHICKKSFSNLQKHMNTHSADKPYGCRMCNRRFFRQKGLVAHMSKHDNDNEHATFTCAFDNCNSAFTKQCKLDFHTLKYHTNHTPHVCQYCSKGFYRLADLRKHVKGIHQKDTKIIILETLKSNNI